MQDAAQRVHQEVLELISALSDDKSSAGLSLVRHPTAIVLITELGLVDKQFVFEQVREYIDIINSSSCYEAHTPPHSCHLCQRYSTVARQNSQQSLNSLGPRSPELQSWEPEGWVRPVLPELCCITRNWLQDTSSIGSL
jgi:hypothetical protein